jgi:hypothetical protein
LPFVRRLPKSTAAVLSLAAAVLAAGCSDGGEPLSLGGSSPIALTLTGSSETLELGSIDTVTVTVARRGYSGTVDLTLDSVPSGVTASLEPATLAADVTSSTLLLLAGATTVTKTYVVTVRASGDGVADQTADLRLPVVTSRAPSFAFLLSPAALSVARGASATARITAGRSNASTDPITFAVTGAPAGVTATVTPSDTSDLAATLDVSVAGNAAPGQYTLTVTGSTAGLDDRTATLTLDVTASAAAVASRR